ncbi:uncharacterized protein LOC111641831 [Centruroides sculpturatus]|uniref:uncharacterized protein LOC111641831 n=1 Tax=Centruroides sculpturatus TaxID=218467 RepID=UPI000C6E22C8|nr:uncharacterized protein LOC111641831 [Centruroides sculpturatus]XP_023243833.1 uncharacterized protein LOC111641831 [Centruroides sculpturatus]XP_023243834.1 uncharacterized protein LOC111641831 [Centruroides sculpturatus]XP_023243835.1 uncharacterized protein LOC111641831 [Centruroides sculpturatus]
MGCICSKSSPNTKLVNRGNAPESIRSTEMKLSGGLDSYVNEPALPKIPFGTSGQNRTPTTNRRECNVTTFVPSKNNDLEFDSVDFPSESDLISNIESVPLFTQEELQEIFGRFLEVRPSPTEHSIIKVKIMTPNTGREEYGERFIKAKDDLTKFLVKQIINFIFTNFGS